MAPAPAPAPVALWADAKGKEHHDALAGG